MHRTMIQLEDTQYELLKNRAFEEGVSLAALLRKALDMFLGRGKRKKKLRIDQFKFIGCGQSGVRDLAKRHDDYLANAVYEHIKERRK